MVQALQAFADRSRGRQVHRAALGRKQGLHGARIVITQAQRIVLNRLQTGAQGPVAGILALMQSQQAFDRGFQGLAGLFQKQAHFIAVGKINLGFHTAHQGGTADVLPAGVFGFPTLFRGL